MLKSDLCNNSKESTMPVEFICRNTNELHATVVHEQGQQTSSTPWPYLGYFFLNYFLSVGIWAWIVMWQHES